MVRKLLHLIICYCFFVLFTSIGYCDYFPHEDRWMISILQSKSLVWNEKEFKISFSLTKAKKIRVQLVFDTTYYDYDRKWRSKVIQKMNILYPKIVKQVYKYGSQELLIVFEAKLDIEWEIYLSSSLYGTFKQGKLHWKKGIY